MFSKKIILSGVLIIVVIILGSIIYFNYNPIESHFFPKCPFLLATGYKCAGCGSQRTIHALLHLNIGQAFKQNALLVVSIPYVILLIYGQVMQFLKPSYAKFNFQIQRPEVIWVYFTFVLLFWITRNIFDF